MSDLVRMSDIPALSKKLALAAEAANLKGAVLAFDLKGDGFVRLDTRKRPVGVMDGEAPANCTLVIGAEDFFGLCEGSLDMPRAFRQGRFTVKGDMDHAYDFELIFAQIDHL